MLMETDWEGKPAYGDALFRTGLLYIAVPEHYHADAIDRCFSQGYAIRHPTIYLRLNPKTGKAFNDCSLDQVIMAFTAIYLNDGAKALPRLRNKFSDKFRQTPDMKWWIRALKRKRGYKIYSWLFCVAKRITLPIMFRLNDFLWKWSKKLYWKIGYPYYALHLGSWMTYTLPESRQRAKLRSYILKHVETVDRGNMLLRLLNGGHVDYEEMKAYPPRKDLRWQRRIDRIPPGVDLNVCDNAYPFDKMVLEAIYERENE